MILWLSIEGSRGNCIERFVIDGVASEEIFDRPIAELRFRWRDVAEWIGDDVFECGEPRLSMIDVR